MSKLPPDVIDEIRVLADMLKSVRVYSFLPPHIRETSRVKDPPVLGYYRENLARFLLHLFLEDRRRYMSVESVRRVHDDTRSCLRNLAYSHTCFHGNANLRLGLCSMLYIFGK